jgi:hypothetical protein
MKAEFKPLVRTILRLDSEGSFKMSGENDSAALKHLVKYLSQRTDSDRRALLKLLRNVALDEYHILGRPIDAPKIGTETKENFCQLLLNQPLGIVTTEDIDALYEAIARGELFSG